MPDLRPSVLFLNRVHPPEPGATGQLLRELTSALARRGWRVGVLTCGRADGLPRLEERDGVRILRTRSLPLTKKTAGRRLGAYASAFPAMLAELGRCGGWDACVVMTDPPLLPLLGGAARALLSRPGRPCRLALWVQDLHPELAEGIGVVRSGSPAARLLRVLARLAHGRSDRIICIGRCMAQALIAAGVAEDRLSVVPNWSDAGFVRPVARADNEWARERGLSDGFVVMHSGNMGHFHRLSPILEAAETVGRLRGESSDDVRFVFVGDGVKAAGLRLEARRRGLGNVLFLPPQPYEALPEALGAADLHLASMRAELLGLMAPSKVYGALAAGRPCLFLGPAGSEPARTLLENDCGEIVADAGELARAVLAWRADPVRRQEAGRRARLAALAGGLEGAAEAFEGLLLEMIGEGR